VLGKPEKGCWELEWGGAEEGEVSLQVTWDQGGRDPIMPRRVSKYISKGEWKGSKKELARGEKARGLRHNICQPVYKYITTV
jgi:hypothetical protein